MLVVVGLRNPEPEYHDTRHNIGAEVVEVLSRRWDAPFKRGPRRVRSTIAHARVRGSTVMLALPNTSMNLSGTAVVALLRYFKTTTDELLVASDDIDLPFARLRLHFGRGSGGHNGVQSVVQSLGTREFWRLKVGVGRPPGRTDPADHVLRPFAKVEREEVEFLTQDAADVIDRFVDDPDGAIQLAGQRTSHSQ